MKPGTNFLKKLWCYLNISVPNAMIGLKRQCNGFLRTKKQNDTVLCHFCLALAIYPFNACLIPILAK